MAENQRLMTQLNAKMEELHVLVKGKIDYYRQQFDDAWVRKNPDSRERSHLKTYLCIWHDIDLALQYNWRLSNTALLPNNEQELVSEVGEFIERYRNAKVQIKSAKANADSAYRMFIAEWNFIYDNMLKVPKNVTVLLTPEIVHQFGLDVSDESLAVELSKKKRDKLIGELVADKAAVVQSIVSSLAKNHDKTSIIDGQFNATKLQLFRVYYRLKANPDDSIKAFETQLAEIEKEYCSLIDE